MENRTKNYYAHETHKWSNKIKRWQQQRRQWLSNRFECITRRMSDQPTRERDSIPLEGRFMYFALRIYQLYVHSMNITWATANQYIFNSAKISCILSVPLFPYHNCVWIYSNGKYVWWFGSGITTCIALSMYYDFNVIHFIQRTDSIQI